MLWSYSRNDDPRYVVHDSALEVRSAVMAGGPIDVPFKVGTSMRRGWAAHYRDGLLLVKYAGHDEAREYADMGASGQIYSHGDFTELETLGPLTDLAPGDAAEHHEDWAVHLVDEAEAERLVLSERARPLAQPVHLRITGKEHRDRSQPRPRPRRLHHREPRPCSWTVMARWWASRRPSTTSRRPARCGPSRIPGCGGLPPSRRSWRCCETTGPVGRRRSRRSVPAGQMHGMVLLDEDDQVVRPAILWNDSRTAAQCEAMREAVGRERFIAITGNDALTSFTATKMLWVREHEPENWARARHLLLPKDYVRFMLTGEHALDVNDGAGTVLFDLKTRTWSDEVVAALEIDPAMLPRTVEGPEVVGVVTEEAAAATGLRAGTPVVGGAGDQAGNAVGMGAVVPGIAAMSVGTSGVIFVPTAGPAIEPDGRLQAFCHAVPGAWHLMGVTMSAAGSLKWLRDELAPDASWDELTALAAERAARR